MEGSMILRLILSIIVFFNLLFSTMSKAEQAQVLTTIDGVEISLHDLKGKNPVYILFFEPYSQVGVLDAQIIQQQYGDQLEVIGISPIMNSNESVLKWVRDSLGVTYSMVLDKDYSLSRRFGAWSHPTQIIINKEGVVVYGSDENTPSVELVKREIAELLGL